MSTPHTDPYKVVIFRESTEKAEGQIIISEDVVAPSLAIAQLKAAWLVPEADRKDATTLRINVNRLA